MAAIGVRIGELARRTGASPELLRAWEQRYGLLHPERSSGGFRLYTADDEARVRSMTELIASGLSAAEAAQQALAQPSLGAGPLLDAGAAAQPVLTQAASALRRALDAFDGHGAHAALDQLLAIASIDVVVTDVLIPYLHELGDRWAAGEATVAQEHFASNLIRGRLLVLARDWGLASGRSAVLACLPGEEHDMGLLMFGVLVARHGWRTTYLGGNAPLETVLSTVRVLRPDATVLVALDGERVRANRTRIRAVAAECSVHLAAPVEDKTIAALGATPMPFDIVRAAAEFGS